MVTRSYLLFLSMYSLQGLVQQKRKQKKSQAENLEFMVWIASRSLSNLCFLSYIALHKRKAIKSIRLYMNFRDNFLTAKAMSCTLRPWGPCTIFSYIWNSRIRYNVSHKTPPKELDGFLYKKKLSYTYHETQWRRWPN